MLKRLCGCLALPALALVLAAAAPAARPSPVRTIQFSGYDWAVKSSVHRLGPGPNYFSSSTDNVWVDSQGRLHLRITYSKGRWYCAEVIGPQSLGRGTYTFTLDSPVDSLDPNVTLALYTWSDDPAYNNREIDIEFGRFGNASTRRTASTSSSPTIIRATCSELPSRPA